MGINEVLNTLMPIAVLAFVGFIFYRPFKDSINKAVVWLVEKIKGLFGKGKEGGEEFTGGVEYFPRDGFDYRGG